MFAGILGTWNLLANISQGVAVNDRSSACAVIINICNRGGATASISIAISTSSTAPTAAEWIEWNTLLTPKNTLERQGILVPAGKYVVVRSNRADVNAVVYGVQNGELITVAGITQNAGTSPTWITDTTLPIFYAGDSLTNVQLQADDPELESVTYSISSGSFPTGLSMSSSGLITGTADVTGYTSGIPDASSTVTVAATDTSSNSSSRSFNIVKRWADGSSQALAATNAQTIYNLSATFRGSSASNWFWIKGDTQNTSEARRMYCSMNGAGYMLWYHYRDPMSGSLSITDPGTSGTTYTLTSTTVMFMYALPAAIANSVTYLYLNSDNDASYTTPSFANFKYAVGLDSELRQWLTTTKTREGRWGVANTPVNVVRYTTSGLPNYRFGSSIGEMQYGHNQGGGDEVDGLAFRNTLGTGGAQWTSSSDIWNKAGWGPIDASSPTSVNTGWGSTGIDESSWGGTNRQNHIYAWVK